MTSPSTTVRAAGAPASTRPLARLLDAGRDQARVGGAQLLAGLGNLTFVAVAARVLAPAGFGHLATLIALITALNLPGAGLAAAAARSPDRARGLAARCAAVGAAGALLVVVLARPLGELLGLPSTVVLALAAAVPAAPLLGLQRGIAYGRRDHRAVAASLLAEPVARLALGLAMASVAGVGGAAWGTAAGGWLALAALHVAERAPAPVPAHLARPRRPPTSAGLDATGAAFVVLALLQHQDLILAHRVLDAGDAAAFAALSAIGGVAAFATATIPLVLLPSHETEGSLGAALGGALAVTVGATLVALAAAPLLVRVVVGARYLEVAPTVPVYVAAMGALGVARVLAAWRCARGDARRVLRIAVTTAALHGVAVLAFARTPAQAAGVTAVALFGATGVFALPRGWGVPAEDPRPTLAQRIATALRRPDVALLVVLTIVAVLVRLATERSLWVDEAISVQQAQLPFGEMLDDLRRTDVHPPLHHVLLWVSVRVLGTAEWAVRMPSVLLGAALVPVLHGLAREVFDRRTARLVAVLAVPAPFLVWYSQEARMYSLFMVLGVGSLWAQVVALRRRSGRAYVVWGVLTAAMVWTQWFALLPIAVQQVATVVHLLRRRSSPHRRTLLGWWLASLGVTAVLLLPLLPLLLDQLSAYEARGAGLSTPSAAGTDSSSVAGGLSAYAVLANVAWALVGYHSDDVMVSLGALWPLAMLAGFLVLGRKLTWSTRLLAAVAVLPGLALFVIAHSKRDLFELRYFVLAAPLLLLLAARATTTVAPRRSSLAVLAGVLVAVSGVALVDQQLNGTNPRLYDFRGAVAAIDRTAEPGDMLAYAPGYLDGVLSYYAPDLDGVALDDLRGDGGDPDRQVFVVVSERFLTDGGADEVGEILAGLEHARGAPERIERPNVVVWRFS